MPLPLTKTQLDTVRVICEFYALEGRYPTYREIGIEMDLVSKGAISRTMRILRQKGWIGAPGYTLDNYFLLRAPHFPDYEPVVEITSKGKDYIEQGSAA